MTASEGRQRTNNDLEGLFTNTNPFLFQLAFCKKIINLPWVGLTEKPAI